MFLNNLRGFLYQAIFASFTNYLQSLCLSFSQLSQILKKILDLTCFQSRNPSKPFPSGFQLRSLVCCCNKFYRPSSGALCQSNNCSRYFQFESMSEGHAIMPAWKSAFPSPVFCKFVREVFRFCFASTLRTDRYSTKHTLHLAFGFLQSVFVRKVLVSSFSSQEIHCRSCNWRSIGLIRIIKSLIKKIRVCSTNRGEKCQDSASFVVPTKVDDMSILGLNHASRAVPLSNPIDQGWVFNLSVICMLHGNNSNGRRISVVEHFTRQPVTLNDQ